MSAEPNLCVVSGLLMLIPDGKGSRQACSFLPLLAGLWVGGDPAPDLKAARGPREEALLWTGATPLTQKTRVAAGAAGRAGGVPGTAAMGTAELGIFN